MSRKQVVTNTACGAIMTRLGGPLCSWKWTCHFFVVPAVCLRKILRLHTTYIQRQNTNEYVYQRANEIVNGAIDGPTRKIKPLTEILEERKLRLLGHVLRRDRQHPLHQTTFSTTSAVPRETNYRRVGRPRQFWTTNNMEKAWEIIKREDTLQPQLFFDKSNRAMRERIIEQAQQYGPPFSKPKHVISQ